MGIPIEATAAEPVSSAERYSELDALRGFALLGVLIANFVWFAYGNSTMTEAQSEALLDIPANRFVICFVELFVSDKANTLFAFLFGLGFWVQMQRLQARGAAFERIYLRRLLVLLVFGLINILLIWPWDILNLYALAGFLLFALRGLSMRAMLSLGLTLALLGKPLVDWAAKALGISGPAHDMAFGEAAVLER